MTPHALRDAAALFVAVFILACGGREQEQEPVGIARLAATTDLACTIQAGGCSEFIGNGSGYIWLDGRTQSASYYVGKTLCIKPGTYTGIGLYQVVASAAKPAVITNCGGQVILNSTNGSPFLVGGGSRYLKITGTGSSAHTYGLVAGTSGGNQAHLDLREGTSDVEIDHVEVRGDGNGGVGIAFRTYPQCDGKWSRGTWAQYNTKIHDTYVHDTKYEGMYIGPSHYGWISANGLNPGFDCGTSRQWEAEVLGLEVINNRVENIGNDGIQIGAATQGMTVRHNIIKNYGLNSDESHSGGITVNPGSKGLIDSNWIEAPQPYRTQGIAFQGTGGSTISNNVIVGGRWGAMFLRNSDANMGVSLPNIIFDNNTVVSSTYQALYFFCSGLGTLTFANNLVAGAPTPYAANGNITSCVQSLSGPNLLTTNLSAAGFVNPAVKDFHLLATSPAVGAGVNLSGVVDSDYDGVARGTGAYDLGAYARVNPPANQPPTLSADVTELTVLEGDTAQVVFTGADPEQQALTWTVVQAPDFAAVGSQSATSRTFQLTPGLLTVSQDTDFSLKVKVSDGALEAQREVIIHLKNRPAEPGNDPDDGEPEDPDDVKKTGCSAGSGGGPLFLAGLWMVFVLRRKERADRPL